jgi:hypothetical protein
VIQVLRLEMDGYSTLEPPELVHSRPCWATDIEAEGPTADSKYIKSEDRHLERLAYIPLTDVPFDFYVQSPNYIRSIYSVGAYETLVVPAGLPHGQLTRPVLKAGEPVPRCFMLVVRMKDIEHSTCQSQIT